MTETNTPIILNLAGDLSPELTAYFAAKDIRVVNPLTEKAVLDWTHILVRDLDNFDIVGDTYGTLEKDIKVISLSQPQDLKNFMMNNGKFVIDETWLKGPFGQFLLDKFFQEYGGVNLSDNYPKFRELGAFNITNPFNTGEYLDHLVYNAFENGTSALSIKTYFDHLLMYLTSLKNKGRVGFPIEVSYGTFDDIYGLQMHFFSQDMQIEDVTNSLTSSITKTPEEYLLYVALQSSDFFDFTYLPEVSKVVVTGLWTKDESVKAVNKGLMFTHSVAANVQRTPMPEASPPFVLNEGGIEDLSSLVAPAGESEVQIIPAELPAEEEEFRIIPAHEVEEQVVSKISGSAPEKEVVTKVKGSKEEPDKTITKISGAKEEKDNFKVTLSGGKEEKKGNMTVRKLDGAQDRGPGMFEFGDKGLVKEGTSNVEGKKGAALFKVSGPSKREGELEKKLNDIQAQNDELKSKLMTAMSELKVQKDTHARLKKISEEAAKVPEVVESKPSRVEEILRQTPNKAPSERETKMAEEFRELEKESRKVQLEAAQKELRLGQEIEKLSRMVTLKDSIVEKTKETMAKSIEKKDGEIASLKEKLEQVNQHLAFSAVQGQSTQIKELERQTINQSKMIEMYKAKISTLSATLEASKSDDNQKEESRKLQLANDQLKTQLEAMKRDLNKNQERANADATLLMSLKQEKAKLADALKKAEQTARMNQAASGPQHSEMEVKRLQGQVQLLETYLKESNTKVKDLELKLQNSLAVNRSNTATEDGQSKVKISHLENSVKKLTQDLVESRNQLAEGKKEVNKLRQEKTALQNLLDKAKKDLEKYEKKPASPKKAG
jgi:chromosome segregation ATPase